MRVELPGIDPDKDVEITLDGHVLRIRAERRSAKTGDVEGRTGSEFMYGSFERGIRVPKGVTVDDVKASYKDGILEVTVPYQVPGEEPRKVAIERH